MMDLFSISLYVTDSASSDIFYSYHWVYIDNGTLLHTGEIGIDSVDLISSSFICFRLPPSHKLSALFHELFSELFFFSSSSSAYLRRKVKEDSASERNNPSSPAVSESCSIRNQRHTFTKLRFAFAFHHLCYQSQGICTNTLRHAESNVDSSSLAVKAFLFNRCKLKFSPLVLLSLMPNLRFKHFQLVFV